MNEAHNQKPLVYRADSIEILNFAVRTRNALLRANVETVGQLLDARRAGWLMAIRNFGEKAYDEVESRLESVKIADDDVSTRDSANASQVTTHVVVKEIAGIAEQEVTHVLRGALARQLRAGLLHPNVEFEGKALGVIANVQDFSAGHYNGLVRILTGPLTVFEELEEMLAGLPDRSIAILRLRFGFSAQTLESVGDRFGVSRERIRQIAKDASRRIRRKMHSMTLLRIASALEFANDETMRLSFDTWAHMITESGLRGDWRREASLAYDPLEMMIAVCRATNWGCGLLDCSESLLLILKLRQANRLETPARLESVLQRMDQKLRRLTIRHLNHSGAISLDWLIQQDGAQYDRIQLQNVLLASGFEQANDDWLVAGSDLSRPRDKSNVFHNSLCKMFAFCGPLGLADIMGGLEHALSKTDFPIPSASILSAVLGRGGYTLDGDKWCFEGTFDATLNRGEKVIMRTIVGNGHVAHHSQLAHAVISSSLSFPSLHATLTRSPLFAKFERSLYKLRGSTPSQTAIEQCMQAHGQVRVNLRSDYDLDGNIVIEASLGTLAIGNGTVTSERLPNLAGEWLYSSDEGIENAIVATSNEIRGLRTAFESLGCRVGDRIRLVFSTDHRRVALSKI